MDETYVIHVIIYPLPFPSPSTQNVWIICLKESYWYIISTVLLVAIMVLWRPSAGARHHLYTPIQCDDEGNVVQKENKHDDWVKRVKVFSPGEGEVAPLEPSNEMVSSCKSHLFQQGEFPFKCMQTSA